MWVISYDDLAEDHPRVCGEQSKSLQIRAILSGSPPRVRGTAPMPNALHATERITPACAGNSGKIKSIKVPFGDHPRVCGEQLARLRHPQ